MLFQSLEIHSAMVKASVMYDEKPLQPRSEPKKRLNSTAPAITIQLEKST